MLEIISKGGKYWMRNHKVLFRPEGYTEDYMIYGIKTDEPYYRWCGHKIYLDEEQKLELAAVIAAA